MDIAADSQSPPSGSGRIFVLTGSPREGKPIHLRVTVDTNNNPTKLEIDGDGDGEYRGLPIDYPRLGDWVVPDQDDYTVYVRPHELGFEGASRIIQGGDMRETRLLTANAWNIISLKPGEQGSDNSVFVARIQGIFEPYKKSIGDEAARNAHQQPVADALMAFVEEVYSAYRGAPKGKGLPQRADLGRSGRG